MRRETGEAILAGSPELRPGGPTLSSLVGRIAESRGLRVVDETRPATSVTTVTRQQRTPIAPLSLSSAGLVTPPPASRMLEADPAPVAGLVLLGAHGGAGVSSLLRAGLDEVAVDAQRRWPQAGAVVLVARTSTSGLEWARDLARQHASGLAGDAELFGLVLVPDAPGRVPARTAGLRDLITGAFPRTWHLPWIEQWRVAAATEPLPPHPQVQDLTAELARTPRLSHPRLSRTTGMTRTRGDLL